MAKIWQDIELTWSDETYKIRPTLELINTLEQGRGCSLSSLIVRMSNNDLPSGIAAEIVAKTLEHAGVTVTAEDVFEKSGGIGQGVIVAASGILIACLPAPKDAEEKKEVTQPKDVAD